MKISINICILISIIIVMMSCDQMHNTSIKYPLKKKVDSVEYYFDVPVNDPYQWLEDDCSEETKQWVSAQNKVTDEYLNTIPFKNKIKDRLSEIWNYEKMSTPIRKADMLIYSRNNGLQDQSIYYYKKSTEGEEKVLIDPNTLSNDGTIALQSFSISKEGKYMAYSISEGGSDWNDIYVKEIEKGQVLSDHIKWSKFGGIAWYKNGFFYSRYEEPKEGDKLKGENKNQKVYYHKLGDEMRNDELIYEDTEHPNWAFSVKTTDDEKYLIFYVSESTSGNALYIKKIEDDRSPVVKVIEDFEYDYFVEGHIGDDFFLSTNYKAPNLRVVKFKFDNLDKETWRDLRPEQKDVITGVHLANNKCIVTFMKGAHDVVKVYDLEGKFLNEVDLPSIGAVSGFKGDASDKEIYFTFESFTYPSTIYKLDLVNDKAELYWKPKINIKFEDYVIKQVFYPSIDGTKIPMFIVHRKGLILNGENPTNLYGYGGFNISLTPIFSISRMILLENNGVLAVPNIRGGGEYGKDWHEAGTKLKKQNVFDDFIAAAEYLIDNKYTNPQKLSISGGSNGGLLMGAVTNQRPDLIKVAVPQVGVMDMLRYHKFTIGHFWASDYGTSADSKEMFNYLYAYSPLHNVKENINYPAIMVLTADHDDRVVPAHSFKYIANLQEKYKGPNPVLIRIEAKAGHGAGKPTNKRIEEASDIWSFIFYNMGVVPYY